MTEQVSLKLNYPKQAGPHYQRYGHECIEGDARCEDLAKRVRYSSPAGGPEAHFVYDGVHHYNYNVNAEYDKFKGEQVLREDVYDAKGTGKLVKTQNLKDAEGVTVKTNRVTHFPDGLHTNMSQAESIQISNNENGLYSVVRKNNAGEIVGGYEMNLKPQSRTFAQGFAGKIERAAMKLGSIGGGQERPVLTQVVELMFNVAKKIK